MEFAVRRSHNLFIDRWEVLYRSSSKLLWNQGNLFMFKFTAENSTKRYYNTNKIYVVK